jgi:hypothetical protein
VEYNDIEGEWQVEYSGSGEGTDPEQRESLRLKIAASGINCIGSMGASLNTVIVMWVSKTRGCGVGLSESVHWIQKSQGLLSCGSKTRVKGEPLARHVVRGNRDPGCDLVQLKSLKCLTCSLLSCYLTGIWATLI